MPKKRPDSMYLAAYYIARCDDRWKSELEAVYLREAYRMFFEAAGEEYDTWESYRDSIGGLRFGFVKFLRLGRKDRSTINDKSAIVKYHEKWKSRTDEELENEILKLLNKNDPPDPEPENDDKQARTEGGKVVVVSIQRERNPRLRKAALEIHGYTCMGCRFNFEEFYGEIGKGFIEVHHVVPLSESGERETDPGKDLIVLCSNCHSMVHRNDEDGICLSLDELKGRIEDQASTRDQWEV